MLCSVSCFFLFFRLWRLRSFSAQKEKINQNDINYAKRTQFPKKSNACNIIINNELQQKINNGHLVKTNPNKANFGLFRSFEFVCNKRPVGSV